MRFKIDWASLIVRSKFTIFALFYFVFEGNFPSTSPRGAYIWRGDLTEGFLCYWIGGPIFGGAYTWTGLFLEFYGTPIHPPLEGTDRKLGSRKGCFKGFRQKNRGSRNLLIQRGGVGGKFRKKWNIPEGSRQLISCSTGPFYSLNRLTLMSQKIEGLKKSLIWSYMLDKYQSC